MKYTNIFFAKHPHNEKQYIFGLPNLDTQINRGDKLLVKCKSGEKIVVATGPNWIIPSKLAKATASAMGGYWPLAESVGKMTYVSVEQLAPFESVKNGEE